MPWGMGTESLGMIGCIFAENGPLEGGIKSSLNGTIRGAKVDFIRFSCLYPYICESRTLAFSKAHGLSYTHSKVGNDRVHFRGEIPSELKNHILAPILMEIWQFWNVFYFSPFWPSYLTFYLENYKLLCSTEQRKLSKFGTDCWKTSTCLAENVPILFKHESRSTLTSRCDVITNVVINIKNTFCG